MKIVSSNGTIPSGLALYTFWIEGEEDQCFLESDEQARVYAKSNGIETMLNAITGELIK